MFVSRADDFSSNGGFRSKRQNSDHKDILLVHTRNQPAYQEAYHNKSESYKYGGYMSFAHGHNGRVMDCFTHSGFIDSYDATEKISEIKESTFHFAASGSVFLHIRHLQLTDEEIVQRKGDKFKLIAIRVC